MQLTCLFVLAGLIFAAPLNDTDFLTVDTRGLLVNRRGQNVLLRGVNVGGWLIHESWMNPIYVANKPHWANLDTIKAFESRGFNQAQIQELFDTFQDNYLTTTDLDRMASWKVNCIRVPFWYRNFMLDVAGTWINSDLNNNPGFKRLDWIINEAGRRGMYIILDLHGVPGGQNQDQTCGEWCRNDLWTDTQCQETTKKLWRAIANRYKGSPVVAAYDLMNEPQCPDSSCNKNYYNPWEDAVAIRTQNMYDVFLKVVREIDPDHIITLEGVWRVDRLPDPRTKPGWTNLLYQMHYYNPTNELITLSDDLVRARNTYQAAMFIGEFSNMEGMNIFNQRNISWTTWTYKGCRGALDDWFCVQAFPTSVYPETDSFETIKQKWGAPLRTENGFQQTRVPNMMQQYIN